MRPSELNFFGPTGRRNPAAAEKEVEKDGESAVHSELDSGLSMHTNASNII